MSTRLPAWVLEDAESIRREVERYRSLTDEERAAQPVAASRAAARLLAASEDRERALAWRDPLPEDSREKLAALRARYRARREGGS